MSQVAEPLPVRTGLRVGGVQPFTAIDYPGKLAAVVFVQGCPWRCVYCHNPGLQPRDGTAGPAWDEVLAWLGRRVGLIDAVVFSGGEPTLDPALGEAIDAVHALGLAVGLHSAGIYPRRLRELLPRLDWIGLDIKAPLDAPARHDRITGIADSSRAVSDSLCAVLDAGVAYELRTTAHPAWLDDHALLSLAEGLQRHGATHYALQVARPTEAMGTVPALPVDYPAPATLARLRGMFEHFTLCRA